MDENNSFNGQQDSVNVEVEQVPSDSEEQVQLQKEILQKQEETHYDQLTDQQPVYQQQYQQQCQQPYQQPYQQQYQQQYRQTYQPESKLEEPVSVGEWMLTTLVMLIPVVNIIMMFVWAFGSNTNKSKSNYFKAALIWSLIGIGVAVVIIIALVIVGLMIYSSQW